jgi:hypothetical protein
VDVIDELKTLVLKKLDKILLELNKGYYPMSNYQDIMDILLFIEIVDKLDNSAVISNLLKFKNL